MGALMWVRGNGLGVGVVPARTRKQPLAVGGSMVRPLCVLLSQDSRLPRWARPRALPAPSWPGPAPWTCAGLCRDSSCLAGHRGAAAAETPRAQGLRGRCPPFRPEPESSRDVGPALGSSRGWGTGCDPSTRTTPPGAKPLVLASVPRTPSTPLFQRPERGGATRQMGGLSRAARA